MSVKQSLILEYLKPIFMCMYTHTHRVYICASSKYLYYFGSDVFQQLSTVQARAQCNH